MPYTVRNYSFSGDLPAHISCVYEHSDAVPGISGFESRGYTEHFLFTDITSWYSGPDCPRLRGQGPGKGRKRVRVIHRLTGNVKKY